MRVRMWVSCGLSSVGLAALAAVPLGGQNGVGGAVYLGAAVPVGDFADDIGEEAGMATTSLLGQIGTGVARAPQGDLTFMGQELQLTANWVPVWGVSGGVGILLQDRISVDARFGRLTRPELESELKYGGQSEDLAYEQPMAWCRVTLGWRMF